MGDRSAEMLNIMIAVIAIVALMALGFAIFTISKKMANSSQSDLVNQLGQISNSVYTDLDQQVITGARLKSVIGQTSTGDCSICVATLGLLGMQAKLMGAKDASGRIVTEPEATLNGNLAIDVSRGKAPFVQLENISVATSLNSTMTDVLALNMGSILKNSIIGDAVDGDTYTSIITSTLGADKAATSESLKKFDSIKKYSDSSSYAQTIYYDNGQFTTKLDYATNMTNGAILRYDNAGDISKTGKVLSISDLAVFNSYILKNTAGEYKGLVFIQARK